jgi:hypothetical protein
MNLLKLSEWTLIGVVLFFVIGLMVGTCCAGPPLPPAVSVDVDASAQLAIEEEAPVLPDDFAKNDPPRVSAEWMEFIPPAVVEDDGDSAGKEVGFSGFTLFTSDGTWPCKPCEDQQAVLSGLKPKLSYRTIPVPAAGQSPSGLVPYWIAPDGTEFQGNMDAKTLKEWVEKHKEAKREEVSEDAGEEIEVKGFQVVKIDGSSSSAVIAAILDNVARTELMKAGKLNPAGNVSTWLPEIDVDLDDPMLKVLDGLLSKDGMALGGAKISWPAGKRSIAFDPPIDVSYRKILEVSATVKAIEVNGREVVVRMGGRLVPDLKVILK